VTNRQKARQRRREDRAVMVIYSLIIVAILSFIFFCWWATFRTTRYYNVPYPVVEVWDI